MGVGSKSRIDAEPPSGSDAEPKSVMLGSPTAAIDSSPSVSDLAAFFFLCDVGGVLRFRVDDLAFALSSSALFSFFFVMFLTLLLENTNSLWSGFGVYC